MPSKARDLAHLRRLMVDRQLRARGLSDVRVLDAMGRIPREKFVPQGLAGSAYSDCALAIGHGQSISQPYMVALMTESLHLAGDERVLEVGTGSGYQAAVLAELCREVYTVERVPEIAGPARSLLVDELGYGNIHFRTGDGTLGWPEECPFDRLIVTAGAPKRPETLLGQLRPRGEGVVPVGPEHWQCLMHYVRSEDGRTEQSVLCDCVFVKLVGEEGW